MSRYIKKIFKKKLCAVCGKKFMPNSSINKYCSFECKKRTRSKNPKTKTCNHCDKEFKPYSSLDKYCCAYCRFEANRSKITTRKLWTPEQRKRRTGKNNPNYRNGDYTRKTKRTDVGLRKFQKNGKEVIDSMIKERGYVYCEKCDTSNSPRFEKHHIIFRSEKPNHPHLHDKINLIVVCISCHNLYHKSKGIRDALIIERGLEKVFGNDVLSKKVIEQGRNK